MSPLKIESARADRDILTDPLTETRALMIGWAYTRQ
jgi:hypothetical protein